MSLYSHGIERMLARTGLPFCLGETSMDDPEDLDGRAWGVGWTTFGAELEAEALLLAVGGALSSRWGVGCWIFGGRKAGGG